MKMTILLISAVLLGLSTAAQAQSDFTTGTRADRGNGAYWRGGAHSGGVYRHGSVGRGLYGYAPGHHAHPHKKYSR
jgi:hypothetical protein